MPKVVHLAHFYWPHGGGVETHLENVNAELIKNSKYRLSVITVQHDLSLPLTETYQQVRIHRLPVVTEQRKLAHKLSVWHGIWRVRQELFDADIIQIHDVFWWLIPLLPFLPRKKLFITFHGYEGSDAPKWNQILWHRLAAWWTHGNICIGDFHRKWYGVNPTYVSYGGVVQHHKKAKKTKKGDSIFLGRLEKDNGVMKYLRAFKILSRDRTLTGDIYGEGRLRAQAEAYAATHSLSLSFHGFVQDASKLLPYYQVACVSRYLSILESLSSGVPVIAQYDNELQKDYLVCAPFAKWIAITHTSTEIATALRHLSPLPQAAQHWAQAQTWEKVARMYQTLWRSAITSTK